ncbi:hypothetical protein Lal_00031123 [Lupinus albus]|nr:hypothetical protein Lal_00031123 [Lupinus albus]
MSGDHRDEATHVGGGTMCLLSGSTATHYYSIISWRIKPPAQELEEKIGEQMVTESKGEIEMGWGRRLLVGGAGSFPPRCTSKCGNCTPCKPVHVPVPPGTPVTAEYYPEAWRCKCANKYYMP